jgi:transcriptional regulator with XRE-family HTH domain
MPAHLEKHSFGPAIKHWLKIRGWTVQDLAVRVDRSPGYLYRVCRGEQDPTLSLAVAIANALEVYLDALTDEKLRFYCPHCTRSLFGGA